MYQKCKPREAQQPSIPNGSTDPSGLARQHAERLQAVDTLVRLRREARSEIARLIAFLDQSDTYVMTELKDDDPNEAKQQPLDMAPCD